MSSDSEGSSITPISYGALPDSPALKVQYRRPPLMMTVTQSLTLFPHRRKQELQLLQQ